MHCSGHRFASKVLAVLLLLGLHAPSATAAVFIVTNTNDAGAGSLREAVDNANGNPGPDSIEFEIPAADPGFVDVDGGFATGDAAPDVFVIQLLSGLTLGDTSGGTTIDGRTQAAFGGDTNPFGPEIVLDGADVAGSLGLHGDENEVFGLNIQRLQGAGIFATSSGNWIAGNYIGTDPTGRLPRGNSGSGVALFAPGSSNIVGTNGDGTDDISERNLISGNAVFGVDINGSMDNVIAGNFIGTDASGIGAIGNALGWFAGGVLVHDGADGNRVGTDGDGIADEQERNVISGNFSTGVLVLRASRAVVAGNYIGTDVTGTAALPNEGVGVKLEGNATDNRVGTDGDGIADAVEGNLISGNRGFGVDLQGSGVDRNVVAGNLVGTDVTGTSSLGNGRGFNLNGGGIDSLDTASDNLVGTNGDGTSDDLERNVISGNAGTGLFVHSGATRNVFAGNHIGTDISGSVALGNGEDGVLMFSGGNLIGTDGDGVADAAEANVISANGFHGIRIGGSLGSGNVIAGNFIGTDRTGVLALGNAEEGIELNAGASSSRIGTDGDGLSDALERNVISGNGVGLLLINADTQNNVVAGNLVGTDLTGTLAIPNGAGIVIAANENVIGTNGDGAGDAVEGNVVSGNTREGIVLFASAAAGNTIAGNLVGTDTSGTTPLGNGREGILLTFGVTNTRIGTDGDGISDELERNVIAANGGDGVRTGQDGIAGNVVAGNSIGTDATGTLALGNGGDGIETAGRFGVFGTDGDGFGDEREGNVVAFNGGVGVRVIFGEPGNTIRANSIHSNGALGIDLEGDGPTANDPGDGDAGANGLQNFPVLSLVEAGATTRVVGTLNSAPGTEYIVDVYANRVPDPSGFGEGERFLGALFVLTDAGGNGAFDVVLPASTSPGEFIAATATSPGGDTSEFSGGSGIAFLPVAIDIKPTDDPNSILLGTDGNTPVAILGSATFDATTVDPLTVSLADAGVKLRGNGTTQASAEDVDGDGFIDLVVHVETDGLALTSGDTEAVLTAETFSGEPVRGVDTVRVVEAE